MPGDAGENARFVDLIKRALFYFCLDDKYLQEQLCNLKGDNLTLKIFFDEACLDEQKRKSFQEIGVSSSHLDSSSGVIVSKWEPRYSDKSGGGKPMGNSDKSGGGGRGKPKWGAKSAKSGSGVGRGTSETHVTAHNPGRAPTQRTPQQTIQVL